MTIVSPYILFGRGRKRATPLLIVSFSDIPQLPVVDARSHIFQGNHLLVDVTFG